MQLLTFLQEYRFGSLGYIPLKRIFGLVFSLTIQAIFC